MIKDHKPNIEFPSHATWGTNDCGQLGSNQTSTLPFYPPEYVKKSDGTEIANIIDIASSCMTNSVLALCEDETV